jgi:hypothetical protein
MQIEALTCRFEDGVIPKLRAFTSGARNLARNQMRQRPARDPIRLAPRSSGPLRAGFSLRLKKTAPLKMTHGRADSFQVG